MYKIRYPDSVRQNAYENACDCFVFGMGMDDWSDCGIGERDRLEIWVLAYWDTAEPDIEHGEMISGHYHFYPAYDWKNTN